MQLLPIALGAGGSALGGWLTGRKSKEEKAAQAALTQAMTAGQGISTQAKGVASEVQPYGAGFMGMAQKGFQPVFDFWSKLLGGDRSAIMSLLDPEIRRIQEGYATQRRVASELTPRGGARTAMMSGMPYKEMADVNTLITGARPMAAGQLGQLAGTAGQLGLGAYGTTGSLLSAAAQALYPSTGAASGLLSYGLQRRQQEFGMGSQIGKSIFDLIKNLPMFGGKTGSTGGVNTYQWGL